MDAKVTRRYATALYDIAVKRGVLAQVAEDVEQLDQVFQANPKLMHVMGNPQVLDDRKKAILRDLFSARVAPLTLQFMNLLVDKRRMDVLTNLQQEFQRLSDLASGIVRARVDTAAPISREQEARLVAQLSKLTGKRVVVKYSLDPSLRGGAVVWIGDRVIDGSVKGYLSNLAARLGADGHLQGSAGA